VSACKKDPCETTICQPCPSSKVVFQYQDSSGRCASNLDVAARVYALQSRTLDTLYSYSFTDTCRVSFLIADSVVYHVRSTNPAIFDVVKLESIEYQEPVTVTECCLCYPADHVHGKLNNSTLAVDFPAGAYENTPFVRAF
jgi:hypothetical protein